MICLYSGALFILSAADWLEGRSGAVVSVTDSNQWVSSSRPGQVALRSGLEQVTFTSCLVLVNPGSRGRMTDLDRL